MQDVYDCLREQFSAIEIDDMRSRLNEMLETLGNGIDCVDNPREFSWRAAIGATEILLALLENGLKTDSFAPVQ